jgi:ABC-type antimicrobial peptide transport system permease subunit
VLISHEVWQTEFEGRTEVIGRPVGLAAGIYTVVGVLPPRFTFNGERPDFLLPIGIMQHNSQYTDLIHAIARLSSGVSLDTASGIAEPIVRGDESSEQRTARVVPLLEDQVGHAVRPLWMLFGGSTLLLLVACSTAATLLLGDARGRRHEMAVRASLGGGGSRLLRQLAVEHGLLATAAGSAGFLAATWLTPVLVALAPGTLPRLDTVTVDASMGLLALGLGTTTVLLFGLAPALPLAWTPAREVLAESTRQGSPRHHRGQRVVVAIQYALALVLLVGASLFGETILRLTSRPLGFDPSKLAVLSFAWSRNPAAQGSDPRVPPEAASLSLAERAAIGRANAMRQTAERNTGGLDAILRNLDAVPGVTATAASTHVPFVGAPAESLVRPEGQAETANRNVQRQLVTPGYFRAMRISMLRGRPFVGAETRGVVVSRELERQLFGGDALGRRLVVEGASKGAYEVIGIVADVKHDGFTANDLPSVYLSNALGATVSHIVVRSSADPGALLPRLVEAARAADARMIVTGTRTMEAQVGESVAEERLRATLASLFGGAALLLAALGLYSVAARLVIDRRREIGVRVALGARPIHIRALVLRDGLLMAAAGVAVGLPAAFAASAFIRSFLFGVSPTAPRVFLTAAGVLTTAAILATLVPAHQASRTDPADALREC